MPAVNLAAKLATSSKAFQPRPVGLFNGHDLMVAKLRGAYHWHKHDETDQLTIKLREGEVELGPGDMYVVPRGVEHCPVAQDEVHILLVEPTGTPQR